MSYTDPQSNTPRCRPTFSDFKMLTLILLFCACSIRHKAVCIVKALYDCFNEGQLKIWFKTACLVI